MYKRKIIIKHNSELHFHNVEILLDGYSYYLEEDKK